MNFVFVAFIDTFELAASLRTRLGLFPEGGERRVLLLRGPRKDALDPDDDIGFVPARVVARWPEMGNMIERVRRVGSAVMERAGSSPATLEFGRIYLELLMPGAQLAWPAETSAYAERFSRAHLPLRTNPGCLVVAGVEAWQPLPGNLTAVARRVPLYAINCGEQPRVHLIVDFRKKDASDE